MIIKMIEEKLILNNSKTIINPVIVINITMLYGVFLIFLNISNPAFVIRKATAHLIPIKALATILFSKNLSKNSEMIKIIKNDGKTTPSVAKILPKILFCF